MTCSIVIILTEFTGEPKWKPLWVGIVKTMICRRTVVRVSGADHVEDVSGDDIEDSGQQRPESG